MCKLAAVPSVKPFLYLARDEAYVFRRVVNRALFRRRLHGDIVERFTEVYYEGALFGETRADTRWLGVRTDKCPLDLWIYQEMLHELRPDLVIETGTAFGGSALYFASLLDLLGHGRVLTIDLQTQAGRPEHPRIEYYDGSAQYPPTDSEAVAECNEYDQSWARIRCRTEVRTWYRDLGDLKQSLRFAELFGHLP